MKALFSFSSVVGLSFFLITLSQAQKPKSCKGYIIVQEKHFIKTGVKSIDSIFITDNYQYIRNSFLDSPEKPYYINYFNYKNKQAFKILVIPPTEAGSKEQSIDGVFVEKGVINSDHVCRDSIVFLSEQKKIFGFNAKRVLIIWDSVSLKEKGLTSIAFIAEKTFNPNQSKCIPGFILESMDNKVEIKTLNIRECILSEEMDFVLNGAKDIKILGEFLDEYRKMNPQFPTEDVIREKAKELYGE